MNIEIVEFLPRAANRQPSTTPFVTVTDAQLSFSSHMTELFGRFQGKLKVAKVKVDGVDMVAIVPDAKGEFILRKADKNTRYVLSNSQVAGHILSHYSLDACVGKGKQFHNHRFDVHHASAPQDIILLLPPPKLEVKKV